MNVANRQQRDGKGQSWCKGCVSGSAAERGHDVTFNEQRDDATG